MDYPDYEFYDTLCVSRRVLPDLENHHHALAETMKQVSVLVGAGRLLHIECLANCNGIISIIHFLMKSDGVTPKCFLNWRVKCCG